MTDRLARTGQASTTANPHVTAIYRYPVKGMTPELLETVHLTTSECLPADRAWAIENGPGRFDPLAPRHLPKTSFLMLMRDERLATLDARYDDATTVLTIGRNGSVVARGELSSPIGRKMIEQFLSSYFARELRGAPKIVSAPGHMFSDVAKKCVHIVNRESVRALERAAGRLFDPLRFRANLYIDGLPAWAEFDWVGRTLEIGSVRLSGFARTVRCAATDVDPATAERNADVPALLRRHWGHSDFGIYAEVTAGGAIGVGDEIRVAQPPA